MVALSSSAFLCRRIPPVSEWCVGGVNSARGQDSSVGGGAGNDCLGLVHMEEGVLGRVQAEEQGEGETRRESEQRNNEEQTLNRLLWMA